jgi:hypothetical protein
MAARAAGTGEPDGPGGAGATLEQQSPWAGTAPGRPFASGVSVSEARVVAGISSTAASAANTADGAERELGVVAIHRLF